MLFIAIILLCGTCTAINLPLSISSFSTELFKQVTTNHSGNVIVSPFSVHHALAMLGQGAVGQTATAMKTALQCPNESADSIAYSYRTLLTALQGNSMLTLANKIYIQQTYSIKSSFLETVSRDFYAAAETINFAASKSAAKTMNDWVAKQTHNLIQNLIDPSDLDALTRMVLINAIYFKRTWAKAFNVKLTRPARFYRNSKSSDLVTTMSITDNFKYVEDKNLMAKIIELPYANSAMSMFIFLPDDYEGVDELENKLKTYDLTKVTSLMMEYNVQVNLPKFKSTFSINFNEILKKIGFEIIFSDRANFSGLLQSDEPLQVSQVVQKAVIEVDELGAEAAAATAITVRARTASVRTKIDDKIFNANHPFVYTIQERTRSVLFMGRFTNQEN